MSYQCAVCEQFKRKSELQFIKPIEDWICNNCLEKGRDAGISNLEDGKELTEQIRQGEN